MACCTATHLEKADNLCSLAGERKIFRIGSYLSVLLNSCNNPVTQVRMTAASPSGANEPQLGRHALGS